MSWRKASRQAHDINRQRTNFRTSNKEASHHETLTPQNQPLDVEIHRFFFRFFERKLEVYYFVQPFVILTLRHMPRMPPTSSRSPPTAVLAWGRRAGHSLVETDALRDRNPQNDPPTPKEQADRTGSSG